MPDSMDEPKDPISQKDVENAIDILRQAGFFQQYDSLTASEIFNTLHQERISRYSLIFKEHYDPGMELEPYQIACLDHNKMIYFDTEADVANGNNVYVDLIKGFAQASDGQIQPIQIREEWETDSGPITVRFESKGKSIVFHPAYIDDWVADELFHTITTLMEGDSRFYVCQDEQTEMGCGQDIGIIRLTKPELGVLEKAFAWKFYQL